MRTGTHRRSSKSATPPRIASALTGTACLLVVAALLGACSAQATTGGGPATVVATGSSAAEALSANAGGANDWAHVLQVVANLQARPSAKPLVCLLGGSAARESTIGDPSWAAQVKKLGGPSVAAYNLGSRNRTLAQDVKLIKAFPKTPGIVYIGINVGRFTAPPSRPKLDLPMPRASLPPYSQHQYSKSMILSVAKKKALLRDWLTNRYPAFKKNYSSNLKTLGLLVDACQKKGLKPVLLELPRNTTIIGHQLDAPIARYRKTCQALAMKYDIPYVSFVAQAKLPNSSFYDLWHLVEPGRAVWQKLLSTETVALLEKYDMAGGATP